MEKSVIDKTSDLYKAALKEAIEIQKTTEGAIDPWLVKWAKSKYTMPIAIGFGVALLAIGRFSCVL